MGECRHRQKEAGGAGLHGGITLVRGWRGAGLGLPGRRNRRRIFHYYPAGRRGSGAQQACQCTVGGAEDGGVSLTRVATTSARSLAARCASAKVFCG